MNISVRFKRTKRHHHFFSGSTLCFKSVLKPGARCLPLFRCSSQEHSAVYMSVVSSIHSSVLTVLCSTKGEETNCTATEKNTVGASHHDVVNQGYTTARHKRQYRNNSVCELNGLCNIDFEPVSLFMFEYCDKVERTFTIAFCHKKLAFFPFYNAC